MHNLVKSSFLFSRPYFLSVYSEIIAHLSTASNQIQEIDTSRQIEGTEAITFSAPLQIAKQCGTYRDRLISQGYINADYKKYLAAGMSGLLILGLTVGKPLIGVLAGYRYLLLLVGAVMPKASLAIRKGTRSVIAATAWLGEKAQSSSHLTSKGKEYLAGLQRIVAEVTPELLSPPVKPDINTSLLVALYGLEVISDSKIKAYVNLFDLFSTG